MMFYLLLLPILDVHTVGVGALVSSVGGRDDDKILLGCLERVSCTKVIFESIVPAPFCFAGLLF
jgi:hypothetical protein